MSLAAWLVLPLAYLAALGSVAGEGDMMSLGGIFHGDSVRAWHMYRGFFLDTDWGLSGWRHFTSTYVVDLLVDWPVFAISGLLFGSGTRSQFLAGMLALPVVWMSISMVGWIKVARLAWGRDSGREAAVALVHAMPFLFFALGQEYPFALLFVQVSHLSTWTMMPWLLFLWLQVMRRLRKGGAAWLGAASLATYLVTLSDFATLAWFTVPTLLALTLALVCSGRREDWQANLAARSKMLALKIWVPLILATVAAKWSIDRLVKVNFAQADITLVFTIMGRLGEYAGVALAHAPLAVPFWLAFVVLAVGYPLRRWRTWLHGGRFISRQEDDPQRTKADRLYKAVLAWWLPGVVGGTVVAGILGGLADRYEDSAYWGFELRYYLPAVLFPLFVGWALLPWRLPGKAMAAAGGGVAVACVGLLLASPPDFRRLDPFASAFHECFHAHASENSWVGGMGSHWYGLVLADPTLPLQRYLTAGSSAEETVVVSVTNGHSSWGRGQLDFFFITDVEPVETIYPPLDHLANLCHVRGMDECMAGHRRVSEKAVRSFAGEDAAIVECAGVKIAVFAEPKHVNITF